MDATNSMLNQAVAHQPAHAEQNGGEKSAANLGEGEFARLLFLKEQAAAQAQTPSAEEKPTESAPATNPEEATKADSAADTESEAKAEEAEEASDVHSPETKTLDPKLQRILDKRIGREVAKTKREIAARAKAEAERDQLKAQLEAVQRGEAPAKQQALVEVETLADLDRLHQEAKLTLRWAEEQLDRDDFPAEGIKTESGVLTKSDLKKIRMNARIALEDMIPEKRRFLEMREAARQKAYETFPYLQDPDSPEYAEAQEALRQNPWLASVPNAEWIIGVQLEGLRALKERSESKSKPKQAVKPAAKPMLGQAEVSSSVSHTRPSPGQNGAVIQAMSDKLRAKGGATEKDMAAILKAREQLRHSS